MFARNPFNYDADAASAATGLVMTEPSMTQQQFKEETDINTIVKRFGITGQVPTSIRMPSYMDFSEVVDYQSALNTMLSAEQSFLQLPSSVRERFGGDPGKFVEFCSDDRNIEEARRLGLVPNLPIPTPTPKPAQPVNE